MEATLMKAFGVISTTALLLLFGAAVPAFAQEEKAQPTKQEEKAQPAKQEEKAKPAKQEETKPAKQQEQAKTEKQQPEAKPAKQQEEAKPAKQEKQAKTEKQQPEAKPAKQQEEAKPAKQEKQAKADKQEPQTKPAKEENKGKQAEPGNNGGRQQAQQEERGKNGGQQHAQRSEAEQQRQRSVPELRLSARGEGRIPDQRFHDNFGEGHRFRINEPVLVGGYSRFQFDGFWFGFVQPWPAEWYYTDDVYVVFVDGGYYLCNPYYPDDRVSISVVI
jgi:hypothetical protein